MTTPLSLIGRGAGGEVRLLHLITPTYLRITYLSCRSLFDGKLVLSIIRGDL